MPTCGITRHRGCFVTVGEHFYLAFGLGHHVHAPEASVLVVHTGHREPGGKPFSRPRLNQPPLNGSGYPAGMVPGTAVRVSAKRLFIGAGYYTVIVLTNPRVRGDAPLSLLSVYKEETRQATAHCIFAALQSQSTQANLTRASPPPKAIAPTRRGLCGVVHLVLTLAAVTPRPDFLPVAAICAFQDSACVFPCLGSFVVLRLAALLAMRAVPTGNRQAWALLALHAWWGAAAAATLRRLSYRYIVPRVPRVARVPRVPWVHRVPW